MMLPSIAGAATLDGGPSWWYEPGSHGVGSVGIAGGVVVVTENPTGPESELAVSRLRGLSPDDGSALWTISGSYYDSVEPVGDNVLVVEKNLTTREYSAVLRDPSDGAEIWSAHIDDPSIDRTIDDFDRVWVPIEPSSYQAFNVTTGAPIGGPVLATSMPIKPGDHVGGITIAVRFLGFGAAYNRYSTQAMPLYDATTIVGDGPWSGLVSAGMKNVLQVPQWKVPTVSVRSPGTAFVRRGFQNGFEFSKLVGGADGLVGVPRNLSNTAIVGFSDGPNCNVPGPYRANLGEDIEIDVADLCTGNPTSVGGTVRAWVGTTASYEGTTMTIHSPVQAGTGAIIAEVHDADDNATLIAVHVRFGLDLDGCAFDNISRGAGGQVQASFGCDLIPPGTEIFVGEYPGGDLIGNGDQVTYDPEPGEVGPAGISVKVVGGDPQVQDYVPLLFTLSEHGFCVDEWEGDDGGYGLEFVEAFASFVPQCFGESALTLASGSSTVPDALELTPNGATLEVEPGIAYGDVEGRSFTFTMTDESDNVLDGRGQVGRGENPERCPVLNYATSMAGEIVVDIECVGATIDEIEDSTPANSGFASFEMSHDGGSISTTATLDPTYDGVITRSLWVTYHNDRGFPRSQSVGIWYDAVPSAPTCENSTSMANVAGETVTLTPDCTASDGAPRALLDGSIQRCGPYVIGCASVSKPVSGVIGQSTFGFVVVDGQGVATPEHTWTIITAPSSASDNLYGTSLNNTVHLGAGNDRLNGMAGADRLFGDGGIDSLTGSIGDDYLAGGIGDDVLYGSTGVDILLGGDGADTLDGGDGNDTVRGERGRDTVYSRSGRDTVYARDGYADKINCGAGFDRAYVDLKDSVSSSCESVILGS